MKDHHDRHCCTLTRPATTILEERDQGNNAQELKKKRCDPFGGHLSYWLLRLRIVLLSPLQLLKVCVVPFVIYMCWHTFLIPLVLRSCLINDLGCLMVQEDSKHPISVMPSSKRKGDGRDPDINTSFLRLRSNAKTSRLITSTVTNKKIIMPPLPISVNGGEMDPSKDSFSKRRATALNALHQTSLLIVISLCVVAFSPLPSLTRHLGQSTSLDSISSVQSPQSQAVKLLSVLSAISASVELFLSPLVGVWIDAAGRKFPSVTLYFLIILANTGVVLCPCVATICVSRMMNNLMGGFLSIVANTMIADMFRIHDEDQMGTVLGRQAAVTSLGFLSGTLMGGRLTDMGERAAYGCSLLFSILAFLNGFFRMEDSLNFVDMKNKMSSHSHSWDHATLRQKFLEAPLSSMQLLFSYGSHMRTLALLLMLQSAPIFMGDVFQMFAKEYWGLTPKSFGSIIALFGVLGIVSNITLPVILKYLNMKSFSLLAILSSLLFPLATLFTQDYRYALLAGGMGLYSSAQKIGTSAVMASLASELGVPQGQLQGEKASMLALLRIICPAVYGMLYLTGKVWGSKEDESLGNLEMVMRSIGKKLPFVLNIVLGVIAFGITLKNL